MKFDPQSLWIFGTPTTNDIKFVANYGYQQEFDVLITASDFANETVTVTLKIKVENQMPKILKVVEDQYAVVGIPWQFYLD